jgi:hypothetical protein
MPSRLAFLQFKEVILLFSEIFLLLAKFIGYTYKEWLSGNSRD